MDWSKLVSSEVNNEHLASQCRTVLRRFRAPWKTLIAGLDPQLSQAVMDVLQIELDSVEVSRNDKSGYRRKCLKCLRVLGEHYDAVPSSFICQSAEVLGKHPLCGGGFADIWKGTMEQIPVSLKVLRIFGGRYSASERKEFRREALLWRQLRHKRILPLLGVSEDLFAPRLCLISPWMENGNLVEFLQRNPEHDRMKAILEIAEGIQYLHNCDPPVVHGDIKGTNIFVKNDLTCCLADFGLTLLSESRSPESSAMELRGSLRWLPPEMMKFSLFQNDYFTALDIYSFGCSIIEIYTGRPPFSHVKNDAALINEVLIEKKKPPRPSTDLFPSDQLWFLVISCLSFNAKKRPNIKSVISSLKDLDCTSAYSQNSWLLAGGQTLHLRPPPMPVLVLWPNSETDFSRSDAFRPAVACVDSLNEPGDLCLPRNTSGGFVPHSDCAANSSAGPYDRYYQNPAHGTSSLYWAPGHDRLSSFHPPPSAEKYQNSTAVNGFAYRWPTADVRQFNGPPVVGTASLAVSEGLPSADIMHYASPVGLDATPGRRRRGRHEMAIISRRRPPVQFICHSCMATFTTKSAREQHIEGAHFHRRYRCGIDGCSKEYRHPSSLNRHCRSVHETVQRSLQLNHVASICRVGA